MEKTRIRNERNKEWKTTLMNKKKGIMNGVEGVGNGKNRIKNRMIGMMIGKKE